MISKLGKTSSLSEFF
jgi:hypothetical protein